MLSEGYQIDPKLKDYFLKFYDDPSSDSSLFTQGDIIIGVCVTPYVRTSSIRPYIQSFYGEEIGSIVVSNACDLENDKINFVALLPIYSGESFFENAKHKKNSIMQAKEGTEAIKVLFEKLKKIESSINASSIRTEEVLEKLGHLINELKLVCKRLESYEGLKKYFEFRKKESEYEILEKEIQTLENQHVDGESDFHQKISQTLKSFDQPTTFDQEKTRDAMNESGSENRRNAKQISNRYENLTRKKRKIGEDSVAFKLYEREHDDLIKTSSECSELIQKLGKYVELLTDSKEDNLSIEEHIFDKRSFSKILNEKNNDNKRLNKAMSKVEENVKKIWTKLIRQDHNEYFYISPKKDIIGTPGAIALIQNIISLQIDEFEQIYKEGQKKQVLKLSALHRDKLAYSISRLFNRIPINHPDIKIIKKWVDCSLQF